MTKYILRVRHNAQHGTGVGIHAHLYFQDHRNFLSFGFITQQFYFSMFLALQYQYIALIGRERINNIEVFESA